MSFSIPCSLLVPSLQRPVLIIPPGFAPFFLPRVLSRQPWLPDFTLERPLVSPFHSSGCVCFWCI